MLTLTETRYQVLPLYTNRQEQYKNTTTCQVCRPFIRVPEAVVPTFQFITNGAGSVSEAILVNACNDFELTACTISTTTSTADVDGDGLDEAIVDCIGVFTAGCFPGGGAPITGDYYIKITIDGIVYYSEQFTMGCSWTHNLSWTNSCDLSELYYGGNFFNRLYFKELEFQRPEYERLRELKKDGFGKETVISSQMFKRYAFQMLVPDYALDGIFALAEHDTVSIQPFTEASIPIVDIDVTIEGSPNDCEHIVTISFRVDNEQLSKTACCGSVYQNEEFENDCPDWPGGDPGPTAGCEDFDVTMNVDLVGGLLGFTEVGVPADCTSQSIVWTYTPLGGASQAVGSGTGISLGGFGEYTVTVTRCGCVKSDSFTYSDPCGSFELEVSINGNVINASVSGEPSGCSTTWKITNGTGTIVATTSSYAVTATDNYTIEATCGTCIASMMVYVSVDSTTECSHTATISRADTILNAIVIGCAGVVTYAWELDTGTGFVVVGSSATYTMAENGTYRLTVYCDSCPIQDQITVLDFIKDCLKVEICNWPDQWNIFITNECLPATCDPACTPFNSGRSRTFDTC